MTPEQKEMAAAAYRRSGMSWREIGKRVGADKDSLRMKLTSRGLGDGWSNRSKPDKSTSAGRKAKV